MCEMTFHIITVMNEGIYLYWLVLYQSPETAE